MTIQDQQKIPAGYKITEVGVIPQDWEVEKIGNMIEIIGGSQPPKFTFIYNYKPGYIRLIQIRDYKSNRFITYVPEYLAQKKCTKDDIMIGRYGPPVFQIVRGIEGAYNVALMKAVPKNGYNKEYIRHFLRQSTLLEFVEGLSQRSSGQTGVDLLALNELKTGVPRSRQEQQSIATALTDIDSLISEIDTLIVKKQAMKQGAMQQLLTGKKRLQGFSGEREETTLGDVCDIKKGQLITATTCVFGNIPVIAGGKSPAYYHNKSNRSSNVITISASGASAGYIAFHNYPIFASDCSTIEDSDNYSIYFIFYLLQSLQEKIYKMQTGGAQPHIHPSDLNPIKIFLPKVKEQQTIAQFLSDMDNDIQNSITQRDKYRSLKQGMLQQLLTGKIRLKTLA